MRSRISFAPFVIRKGRYQSFRPLKYFGCSTKSQPNWTSWGLRRGARSSRATRELLDRTTEDRSSRRDGCGGSAFRLIRSGRAGYHHAESSGDDEGDKTIGERNRAVFFSSRSATERFGRPKGPSPCGTTARLRGAAGAGSSERSGANGAGTVDVAGTRTSASPFTRRDHLSFPGAGRARCCLGTRQAGQFRDLSSGPSSGCRSPRRTW